MLDRGYSTSASARSDRARSGVSPGGPMSPDRRGGLLLVEQDRGRPTCVLPLRRRHRPTVRIEAGCSGWGIFVRTRSRRARRSRSRRRRQQLAATDEHRPARRCGCVLTGPDGEPIPARLSPSPRSAWLAERPARSASRRRGPAPVSILRKAKSPCRSSANATTWAHCRDHRLHHDSAPNTCLPGMRADAAAAFNAASLRRMNVPHDRAGEDVGAVRPRVRAALSSSRFKPDRRVRRGRRHHGFPAEQRGPARIATCPLGPERPAFVDHGFRLGMAACSPDQVLSKSYASVRYLERLARDRVRTLRVSECSRSPRQRLPSSLAGWVADLSDLASPALNRSADLPCRSSAGTEGIESCDASKNPGHLGSKGAHSTSPLPDCRGRGHDEATPSVVDPT